MGEAIQNISCIKGPYGQKTRKALAFELIFNLPRSLDILSLCNIKEILTRSGISETIEYQRKESSRQGWEFAHRFFERHDIICWKTGRVW